MIFVLGDTMSTEYLLKEIQDLELLHLAADRGNIISKKKETETYLMRAYSQRKTQSHNENTNSFNFPFR